jgi:hypothetical protein
MHKAGYEGYYDRDWEWVSTKRNIHKTPNIREMQFLDSIYTLNQIPPDLIKELETELDSEINSSHCRFMLYDSAHEKFLAFFLCNSTDNWYKNVITGGENKKGGVFIIYSEYDPPPPLQEYIGYSVWGMRYQNNWYYTNDEYVEFNSPDSADPLNKYILYQFYARKMINPEFRIDWDTGNFQMFKFDWTKTFYNNVPEVVGWDRGRHYYRLKKLVQNQAVSIVKENFDAIHNLNPTIYSQPDSCYYTKDHKYFHEDIQTSTLLNTVVYTFSADTILFPFVYSDISDTSYVSFLVYIREKDSYRLYLWKKEPPGQMPHVNDYLKTLGIDKNYDSDQFAHNILRKYQIEGMVEDVAFNQQFWTNDVFYKENNSYKYLTQIY